MKTADVKKHKQKLKELFRGYTHMTRRVQIGLKTLGFRVKTGKKHCKIFYGNDISHPIIVSVSASDCRAGLNIARELASVLSAESL